jgi:N-methylhydantoinase A/oxoprolinase/acetone carboxylase beta subunit
MRFDGPAVVDQEDATILVTPGFRARIDHSADIVLERV